MARKESWLAKERPAMIGILEEMERNSSYTGGGAARGDLSLLLARLAQVTAGKSGEVRSLSAMRQAWWRWTTDGKHQSAPSVQEFALMVRYANNNGWLRDLTRPDCLSLVKRLMVELEHGRVYEQRLREIAWSPTVRIGVEGFIDFLEARVAERSNGELEGIVIPGALVVQQEVRTMFKEVIERVLMSLNEPRELFSDPHETDSFLQPFEGWPETFRSLALDMSDILNGAAEEYEAIEASLNPPPADSESRPRRMKIFGAPPKQPEQD